MIKNIGHIVFAIFMLVTTAGVTISKHYCGNNLQSISVVLEAKNCCDIPSGCCHNEEVTLKIQDDFSPSIIAFDFSQSTCHVPLFVTFIEAYVENPASFLLADYSLPPPKVLTVLSQLQTYLL